MATLSPVARRTLLEVVDNIEQHGHFQSRFDDGQRHYHPDYTPDGQCCIVVNPAWRSASTPTKRELRSALMNQAGVVELIDLFRWNDRTETDRVLATLRGLADG